MGTIRIVADSTCDLSKDLLEQYHISVIPLCIVMEDRSYYDGLDVTPDEIYLWADANKTTPKTSAVTIDYAEKILKAAALKSLSLSKGICQNCSTLIISSSQGRAASSPATADQAHWAYCSTPPPDFEVQAPITSPAWS